METPGPTFGELEGRVLTLFGAGDAEGALDTARYTAARFPDRIAYTAFWIACIEAVKGEPEKALGALVDAIEAGDVWWGRELLEQDEDLRNVRPLSGFERLVEESARRGLDAQRRARVEWSVIEPSAPAVPRRILLALHGRTGNLADLAERWKAGAAAGTTVVVVQSSQMVADGMHCWDDLGVAERDIAEVVRAVAGPDDRIVLGGFSQGGATAVRMALAGYPVHARGFVAVAPGFSRKVAPDDIDPLLPAAAARGVRGWMALGEMDERYRPPAERVARALEAAGVVVEIYAMTGLGHEYPEPLEEVLLAAVTHVLA